jgi:hypothetical protein
MDRQVTELLGRNRLVDELLRAGLEVALPERDRGIDLIAYSDLDPRAPSFVARPIQMKAASGAHFSIYRKYEKFPDLILAFVWNVASAGDARTYALSYDEALAVAEAMGWTSTASWTRAGCYSTQRPGWELLQLLKPHRMTPETWWRKVVEPEGQRRAIHLTAQAGPAVLPFSGLRSLAASSAPDDAALSTPAAVNRCSTSAGTSPGPRRSGSK